MSANRIRWRLAVRSAWLVCAASTLAACATWREPTDIGDEPLQARAVTQEKGGVRLSATVLGSQDSQRYLGTDVTKTGVQPVWIAVRNDTDQVLWLLRSGTDPDYFSPLEVSWSAHVAFGGKTNRRIDEHLDRLAFPNPIPARGTSSGILFTNPQRVTKLLNVDLLGNRTVVPFTLLLPVPGDVEQAYREILREYDPSEVVRYDDPDEFRMALEALPCCGTTADGSADGEPINVVIVGALDDIAAASGRRGYRRDPEAKGTREYVFGRPADHFFRKSTQAGAPANWLRVWLAPISYRGQLVFVVQAGRPVGGRFAAQGSDELSLHPDVDEVRNLLIHDFMYSGGLEKLALAGGVGAVPAAQPRAIAGGGSYYTDGLRAVLFMGTRPRAFSDVEVLDWVPLIDD